jgi:hypothetical protein
MSLAQEPTAKRKLAGVPNVGKVRNERGSSSRGEPAASISS